MEECRIALKNGDALDLQVSATPLTFDGQQFAFCVLKDISDEKRRRMLEHVFSTISLTRRGRCAV